MHFYNYFILAILACIENSLDSLDQVLRHHPKVPLNLREDFPITIKVILETNLLFNSLNINTKIFDSTLVEMCWEFEMKSLGLACTVNTYTYSIR